MKSTDRLLEFLRGNNVFREFYAAGLSAGEIRSAIIGELAPFFMNHSFLERGATTFLVSDYVNLLRVRSKYPGIDSDVQAVMSEYHKSVSIDEDRTLRLISELRQSYTAAANRFWSLVNLERDKSHLGIDEFSKESFENIRDIVEGLMKPYLVELVGLFRIQRGRTFSTEELSGRKLGVIEDELLQHSHLWPLLITDQEGLRFSKWRNIAAHYDYEIEEDSIWVSPDSGKGKQRVALTRTRLFEIVGHTVRTLETLNLAHKFFLFDRMEWFWKQNKTIPQTTRARDEISLLPLVTAMNSQGFDVIAYEVTEDGDARMTLRDMTEVEERTRAIHASQFMLNLWLVTQTQRVSIEYQTLDGTPYLLSSVDGGTCASVAAGDQEVGYMAEKANFTRLSDRP